MFFSRILSEFVRELARRGKMYRGEGGWKLLSVVMGTLLMRFPRPSAGGRNSLKRRVSAFCLPSQQSLLRPPSKNPSQNISSPYNLLQDTFQEPFLEPSRIKDKFGESLEGSQAPPSFWEVPQLPRKFPELPRKFFGDFPGSSLAVEGSFPDFPRSSPNFPGSSRTSPEVSPFLWEA